MAEAQPQVLTLAEFVPAMAELQSLAEQSKSIDTSSLVAVHEMRVVLKKTRIRITATGKALRENAVKFSKDVITREKELIDVISPEEERLEGIEEEFEKKEMMQKRRALLPFRITALEAIGDDVPYNEEQILGMDENEFEAYRLQRVDAKFKLDKAASDAKREEDEKAAAEKRAADDKVAADARAEEDRKAEEARKKKQEEEDAKRRVEDEKRAAEQKKLDDEKAALAAEKAAADAAQKERERVEAEKKADLERREREEKLAAEKAAREKKEREENEKYQAWLKDARFNADTDTIIIINDGKGSIGLYRLVSTYTPEKI